MFRPSAELGASEPERLCSRDCFDFFGKGVRIEEILMFLREPHSNFDSNPCICSLVNPHACGHGSRPTSAS